MTDGEGQYPGYRRTRRKRQPRIAEKRQGRRAYKQLDDYGSMLKPIDKEAALRK